MSSENEMIDQPGDHEPETKAETQQPEYVSEQQPIMVPEEHAQPDSEPADDEVDDGWEAWMSASPEEDPSEDDMEPITEEDETPDNVVLETKEEPLVEEVEVSDDVVAELVETVVEAEEEPIVETAGVSDDVVAELGETAVEVEEESIAEEVEVPAEVVVESETASEIDQESSEVEVEIEVESKETAEDVPVQEEELVAEAPVPPAPKSQKSKKSRRNGLKAKDVITYFAPCGRCGYFLSGYRAAYGQNNFETAVSESEDGWITLEWDFAMPELVLKSYGNVIETNDLRFDGCCSECRRVFTYQNAGNETEPSTFRVEIKPQTGH